MVAPLTDRLTTPTSSDLATGEGLTEDGGVVGTPGYISPERYLGEPATVASDLFAVGVVLYELLSQRSPFHTRRADVFIAAVEGRGYVRLQKLRPDASEGLISAIERCLAFDPRARPASAASLQVLLEESLQGRRVDLVRWLGELFPSSAQTLGPAAPALTRTITALRAELPTLPKRAQRK